MKKITDYLIRITAIMILLGFIIAYFNNRYGAFFLFGAALMSFLYNYFDLIKKYVHREEDEK